MNCEHIRSKLSPYLDGELEHEEAREIREHLEQCPACNEEFRMLSATWDALLADDDVEPAPDYAKAFWQGLAEQQRKPSTILRVLKWSPAMAASFFIAFFAGWISAGEGKPAKPAPPADVAFLRDYEMIQTMELIEDLPMLSVADADNDEGGDE
jgi:anti-sigma factor RsiW